MKQTQKISAVIMMFLLIGVLLLTSFQVAIYGDSQYRFYEREYKKYQVADSLNMTMDNIMDVTDQMMAYLIGKKAELSVITDVDGETQDFFNEQDRFHMGEVKDLFLGGLKIRNIMLGAVLLILILLAAQKAELIKLLPRSYFVTLGITGVITVVLGDCLLQILINIFAFFMRYFLIMINGCLIRRQTI